MAKEKDIAVLSPRENPHLFGHDAAVQRFVADLNGGRMHHAYLISGSKGIGKATLAYRLARHILSQGALQAKEADSFSLFGDDPAPQAAPSTHLGMSIDDPLFRRIAAGSHADLMVLSPAFDTRKGVEKSIITAEEARGIPEFLSLTPAEGDWRVVIVDAVDNFNAFSANALLKILEEPPPRAILFLVSHEAGSVLATIRSRCRQLKLEAPVRQAFDQVLATVAPEIQPEEYAALHALSYGSPGLAIALKAHDGPGFYEQWLKAMQPGAGVAARSAFGSGIGALRSPEAWDTAIHGWQFALTRLNLIGTQKFAPVFRREGELLDSIAAATTPALRRRWLASGRQLLSVTDTYNLDKKATVRLLLEPQQLSAQFAA